MIPQSGANCYCPNPGASAPHLGSQKLPMFSSWLMPPPPTPDTELLNDGLWGWRRSPGRASVVRGRGGGAAAWEKPREGAPYLPDRLGRPAPQSGVEAPGLWWWWWGPFWQVPSLSETWQDRLGDRMNQGVGFCLLPPRSKWLGPQACFLLAAPSPRPRAGPVPSSP